MYLFYAHLAVWLISNQLYLWPSFNITFFISFFDVADAKNLTHRKSQHAQSIPAGARRSWQDRHFVRDRGRIVRVGVGRGCISLPELTGAVLSTIQRFPTLGWHGQLKRRNGRSHWSFESIQWLPRSIWESENRRIGFSISSVNPPQWPRPLRCTNPSSCWLSIRVWSIVDFPMSDRMRTNGHHIMHLLHEPVEHLQPSNHHHALPYYLAYDFFDPPSCHSSVAAQDKKRRIKFWHQRQQWHRMMIIPRWRMLTLKGKPWCDVAGKSWVS